MIIHHNCEHPGQDKIHEKGRRVANKTSKPGVYRCTACGKEVNT